MSLLAALALGGGSNPNPGVPVISGYGDAMPEPNRISADYWVGEFAEYSTVLEAQAAAANNKVPGLWSRIIVTSGSYVEQISPNNSNLEVIVAEVPGTVEFVMPEGGGFSTINTWGGTYFIGGITFTLPEGFAGSGAYGLHHHAGKLSIFEQCTFRSLSEARPGSAGADTDSNTSSYWINCTFAGSTPINFHGAGSDAFPSRHVFVNCVAPGGLGYSASGSVADQCWIVGDDTDTPTWGVYGENARAYVKPGIPPLTGGVTTHVTYTDELPPLPIAGKLP